MASSYLEDAILADALVLTALSNVVSDRVFFMDAPENVTPPYVTFSVISDPVDSIHMGSQEEREPRVQFDCWSPNQQECLDAENAIISRWRRRREAVQGVTVVYGDIVGRRQLVDPSGYYRASLDVEVWYEEPS